MPLLRRSPDITRLTRTLFNQKSDLVPLIELGIHPHIKSAILGRPWQSLQDEIEFMSAMGYDFVKLQPQIQISLNQQKATDAGSTTPGSDRTWAPGSEGLIRDWADFEKYPWPEKNQIDYSKFEEIRSLLPEGMGVIGQYGDIFTLTWELMGFENFALSIYQNPDLVKAVMAKLSEVILEMFRAMSQMDWVNVLWYSDDIAYSSNLMVRPDFLRAQFFPILKQIGDMAKSRHLPLIYHSDGLLWDVMDDIIAAGVNALHPIEPKAMDLGEVKDRTRENLCLCGGIEVDLLARGTVEAVTALVKNWLENFADEKGYCAGSSNSIPEYVNLDNYRAMLDTVLRFQGS
ncbi:MAG: nucleoside 2-deoxyribosyltransferase [Calditrichales bacterium]|nr:MAG: nucleoside 2-deoxyribosyltransferase [Calditrichales bacterium]